MTARRNGFAHLHVHTMFSVLDAMTQHEEMCDEVLADAEATGAELAAIASTDHGTLSGLYKFSKMARRRGVTPLFGNEVYLANGLQEGARFAKDGLVVAADGAELDGDKADGGTGKRKTKRYEHMTLLAETEEGWRNLIRINNAAQAPDAKWGKPRADIDLLCRHSEGIIALTGCLGGPVLGSVARGDVDRARSVLNHMLNNGFDRDHVFLEIMEHGIPQEAKAMRTMLDLGDEFEIAPVATNDAHFAAEGDAHSHEAWLCNATKSKLADPDRWKFHGEGYWLRSASDMRAIFDGDERTQMACDNTLHIAERIAQSGDIMTPSELRLPEFPVPDGYAPSASAQRKGLTGSAAYLNDQIREGAVRRYGSPLPAEVRERLTYEFDVIHSMGLCCHPDTTITMADGTIKRIGEIRSGDEVWTHKGPGTVDYVESRQYEGDLIEITSYGHSTPIRVTPEHPVLTQRGWVPAGDVLVGDEVMSTPRLGVPTSGHLDIIGLLGDEAEVWNLRTDGEEVWRMRPGRWGTDREALGRLPALLEPTDDLMFLIGLYAAEGCLNGKPVNGSQGEIVWTLHEDEVEIVAELARALKSVGGVLRVYRNYMGSKAIRCVVTHHPLAMVLRKLVGEMSHAKSFHPWVMNLPIERQRLVFRAWHMGDGTDRPGGRSTTYTVSERLAWQGVDMLQRFGSPCSLKKVARAKPHHRDIFNLIWRPERKTKPTGRRFTDEGWIASKVRRVERAPHSGSVHNFEVVGHHAYVADGRVVHNCDYFLIVQDLISEARNTGIRVGPGRGSAAGAAISYCLDIVNIDPIRYNLLFERFLNPERIGMPDIDIDFEASGRDWAFGYLARRYGPDRVARIGNFGYALTKGALRSAARVLSLPSIGDELSSAVPTNKNGKPEEFDRFLDPANPSGDEFRRRVAQSPEHEAVAELARSWEGSIDKEGVHACGVIIGRDPLDGELPLRDAKGFPVTQWDGKDLDALGFLKLDALSLRNLDVVTATERLIAETTGEVIDADNPPLDPNDPDPVAAERVRKTFDLLQAGKTAGVFQLESGGLTDLCVRVGPNNLDDIAALVALYRPGPLEAKMEERYALRKHGLEPVDYGIFTRDPAEQAQIATVLSETFGLAVYQEQLMRLGDVVAGFGPIERNRLQKAVSKKLQDEMAAVGELFIAGAMAERRNDDGTLAKMAFRRDTAEKVWDAIKGAGNYAFNASHSYAYGWVTYITAYLKANWPTQYGAALLSVTKKADKRHEMLLSLAAEGIEVVAPRINEALVDTTVNAAGQVVIGMNEVRDVSREDAEIIVAARAAGPFTSLSDFAQRCLSPTLEQRVKIGAFEGLIEAGSFDELGPEGRTCRMGMVLIARALGQLPDLVPFDCEWNHLERARREAHRLGVLISPNPTKYLGAQIRDASIGGIKASPLRKADEQRAGGEFTTAAIVSSWSEQSGHWGRRADVLLTGTGAAVRATIWDKTLHKLRAAGRIPEVGDLVLVKGKIVMRKARLENENGEMADGEAVADEKAEISVWEMQVVDVDGKHFDVPAGPPALHEHWFVRPDGFIDEPEPAPLAVEAPAAGELPFGDPDPVVTTEPVSEPQADPEPSVLAAAPDVATRPADRSVAAPASPFGELLEADPGVVELPWSEGEVDTIIVELAHGSLGASSSTSSALRIMRREVAAVVSAVVHLQRRPHSDGADIADEVRPLVDEMLAGRPVEVVAYDEPQPRSTWLVPADGEWGVAAQAWAEHLASPAPVVALAAPVADRTAA